VKLPFIVTVVAGALFAISAQANTLKETDARRFYSLNTKLVSMNVDITQAMEQAAGDNPTFTNCLNLIHNQGDSVAGVSTAIGGLIVLAALMKDDTDEYLVLNQLNILLKSLAVTLPKSRQVINRTMALCSNFSTVNVKGQAMLNVFSELNSQVASLSKAISGVVKPER
jgi:hypothetical protein